MKLKIFSSALALSLLLSTTSCLDNGSEPESKATMTYGPVFNTVIDTETGSRYYNENVVYQLALNYTAATLGISASELKLDDQNSKSTFQISDLPYKFTTNQTLVVNSPVVSNVVASPGSLNISNLDFSLVDRFIGTRYSPLVHLTYTVNNRYDVVVTSNTCNFFGTLTSTNLTTGDKFTLTDVQGNVIFDPVKGTADLELKGIKFVAEMPRALDMTFPGIEFFINKSGFTLSSASLVPTINNDPFPAYPITQLSATAVMNDGKMSLKFHCHPSNMDEYELEIAFTAFPGNQQENN